jgi:hypothetical protein
LSAPRVDADCKIVERDFQNIPAHARNVRLRYQSRLHVGQQQELTMRRLQRNPIPE